MIGAVARNAWAPPRATTDLDVTIAAADRDLLDAERARAAFGYRPVRRHTVDSDDPLPDLIIFRGDAPALRQVDLLVAKTPFEVEVLRRAVTVEVGGAAVAVATPEDIVVYKLLADRLRDRDDARSIARTRARAGSPLVWAHVERWAAFWGVEDRLAALRSELGSRPTA